MSAEALAIALHHSRATGTARLVLLGIANHDGDGGSWPAIATLSIYAGGVDSRNVQRAIDKLEQLHEVQRVVQGGGGLDTPDRRRPNLYRFLLACPPDCDRTRHHRTRRSSAAPLFTGVADTPPQGGGGVADTPPPGVALAPPELDQEQVDKAPRPALDRARLCSDGSTRHEVSRTSGRCVYCGRTRQDIA